MHVSIVIPCHNAGDYLAQTIGSALDQSRPPEEIIVVDDGSTDESLDLARRFEARCSQVRVFSEHSGRASRTRNLGAEYATGDAIMFLDADDVIAPDVLESLLDAQGGRDHVVSACPWQRLELRDDRWLSAPASCAARREGEDPLAAWLRGWYYPPCAVLWSRRAFLHAGRWDESATLNDDGDLMMRALVLGVELIETCSGTSFYRRSPEGVTSLSDSRASAAGLLSRLRVAEKIARLLQERQGLAAYREPLAEAFDLIAAQARTTDPELSRRASALSRRWGPSRFERIRARSRYAVRAGELAGTRPVSSRLPGQEIRFGLVRAREILAGAAPEAAGTSRSRQRTRSVPAVSIIIPTFRRPERLTRALASVLSQGFPDHEVLVVDDGPSEDTREAAMSFGDRRIRYCPQPRNQGVSAARNRGMREARGEFLAFLDDDDSWLPGKLERQMALFRELPDEFGLIYTGVKNLLPEGRFSIDPATYRGDLYDVLLTRNVLHGAPSSGVMRRRVVPEIGFFDESLPAIEDYDYWLRLSRRYLIECIAEPLVCYHDELGAGREGRRSAAQRRSRNLSANLDARDQFYAKHEVELRDAGVAQRFLLDSARKCLAEGLYPARARALVLRALLVKPVSRPALGVLKQTLRPIEALAR